MVTPARTATLLFGSFGIPPPDPPPPEWFPAIYSPLPQEAPMSTPPFNVPPLPPGAPTLARHLHAVLFALGRGYRPDGNGGAAESASLLDDACREAAAVLEALPAVLPDVEHANGKVYWRDENECLTPETLVKQSKLLEDLFVRTVATAALSTSATLSRLKAVTFAEANALLATLASEHGIEMGGKAGNVSFFSYNRAFKVQISVAERLTVGPSIEVARQALNDWLAEAQASDEVKALVNSAFGLDEQGRVRAAELIRLKNLKITHPTWLKAMSAIDDAMEVAGKAMYLRVYQRAGDGRYVQIPLDLASA